MTDPKRELESLGDVFDSPAEPADAEVQDRVRRVVASHALGVEDCRLLLEALGLLPHPAPAGH
ncbi:hypothetical protein ACGFX4_09705 [Kitasatospora sp. NPDC048365]|uniref:hypothetical protein n=1 Tax=Kitasatospora sp. NPDC048365 TaxID=3364050 RepID=UPI00371A5387